MILQRYNIPGGARKVLLVNPPVYDVHYSPEWSQPSGLLRIATVLRQKGAEVALLDCLYGVEAFLPKETGVAFERGGHIIPQHHYGISLEQFAKQLADLSFYPDEVYVTSVMTYWWPSTRDVIRIVKDFYPEARVVLGGIYPTLAPEHAAEHTEADIVVVGEVEEASFAWEDLSLYQNPPNYAIIFPSRGCPHRCSYCAQNVINGKGMRFREPEDVVDEIEFVIERYGIRRFGIFADNFLSDARGKGRNPQFQRLMETIVERGLEIIPEAPKGMEPRLLDLKLLIIMREAGWREICLSFESVSEKRRRGWGRRHNTNAEFERAVSLCREAGFHSHEISGFLLYGMPGEVLNEVVEGAYYLNSLAIRITPMAFTPVPGSGMYRKYEGYFRDKGLGLVDLNGRLFPMAELNGYRFEDYLELDKLFEELNSAVQPSKDLRTSSPEFDTAFHGLKEGTLKACFPRSSRTALYPVASIA